MTRLYIKLDPNLPDRKDYYPDGAFRALVTVFCVAAHQPKPGTFKNEKLLRVLLAKQARWLTFLIEERDVVPQKDGSLAVPGWVEWQEGSYPSVGARMEAIEKRRRPMTPAERAFVYRLRKKERDAARDASRDAQLPDSNPTSTEPDGTRRRNGAQLKRSEDGRFEVIDGSAA